MVPGLVDAAMPEFEFPMPGAYDLDGLCVRMLQHFFSAACRHADELILVNYSQLPQIVWEDMLSFFSVTATPQDLDAMKARTSRHSKNGTAYSSDPQSALGDKPCADVLPYYERLEELRCAQDPFRSRKNL